MIELGVSSGPDRVEHRSYSAMVLGVAEAEASAGLLGVAVGAVETAASLYSRAFSSAKVEPSGPRTEALTAALLGDLARRLVLRGESFHLLDVVDGRPVLTAASWSTVTGGPRRESWRYRLTLTGPSTTSTVGAGAARVAHCAWSADAVSPWRGRGPLALAGESGRLAKVLERALADEVAGPVGHLLALPVDASDGDEDPLAGLKRQIANLRGSVGLVESTAAGFGEGRAAAPAEDWKPRRIGAAPPIVLAELRQQVEATILGACGVPVDLARAGGRGREAFRQFVAASVAPLARVVEEELSRVLDVEVRLRLDALGSADVTGRARAYRSLVGTAAAMPDADARRLVGFD